MHGNGICYAITNDGFVPVNASIPDRTLIITNKIDGTMEIRTHDGMLAVAYLLEYHKLVACQYRFIPYKPLLNIKERIAIVNQDKSLIRDLLEFGELLFEIEKSITEIGTTIISEITDIASRPLPIEVYGLKYSLHNDYHYSLWIEYQPYVRVIISFQSIDNFKISIYNRCIDYNQYIGCDQRVDSIHCNEYETRFSIQYKDTYREKRAYPDLGIANVFDIHDIRFGIQLNEFRNLEQFYQARIYTGSAVIVLAYNILEHLNHRFSSTIKSKLKPKPKSARNYI